MNFTNNFNISLRTWNDCYNMPLIGLREKAIFLILEVDVVERDICVHFSDDYIRISNLRVYGS